MVNRLFDLGIGVQDSRYILYYSYIILYLNAKINLYAQKCILNEVWLNAINNKMYSACNVYNNGYKKIK